MSADTQPAFTLGNVQTFGDPTEGESQGGVVKHRCAVTKKEKIFPFNFSRAMSGSRSLICTDCGDSTEVVKSGGWVEIF